jgi:ribulose-5-phosphate 4-epimerase/fuculose-1-phosphate aldolase
MHVTHIQDDEPQVVVGFMGPGLDDPALAGMAAAMRDQCRVRGFEIAEPGDERTTVILNFIDSAKPKPFRRRRRPVFVVSVDRRVARPADVLRHEYPLMVQGLANLGLLLVPGDAAWFVTPEQGCYEVAASDRLDTWMSGVFDRLLPLATARLIIDNRYQTDLEPELWGGDELTEQLNRAGRRLDEMGLLPAPVPLEGVVNERELRAIKRIYGIGGLSYGNLSVRKDPNRFWMSASGVDKSDLRVIGRDILMVSGFDADAEAMVLSVPPAIEPRRVSVDAIEHWMIYTEHPAVSAIVHVHAWIPGVAATQVNYPCGTAELAGEVAALVRLADDPARAVIGLKNHGLTITGTSLDEIFDRVSPVIEAQVPMTA